MVNKLRNWCLNRSISTLAAVILSISMTILFTLITIMVYYSSSRNQYHETLERLTTINSQSTRNREELFSRIIQIHQRAVKLFQIEQSRLDSAHAMDLINELYPLASDGNRHSTRKSFDGYRNDDGYFYGFGAYMPGHITNQDARILTAASWSINSIVEANQYDLRSMFFFTPGNAVIMFEPGRRDKLAFFRTSDPHVSAQYFNRYRRVFDPQMNPTRKTICNILQTDYNSPHIGADTASCITPVDVDGTYIGSFGSSISLDTIGKEAIAGSGPEVKDIVVSEDGWLLSHSDIDADQTPTLTDLKTSSDPSMQALWAILSKLPKSGSYDGLSHELNAFISIRKIPAAGWYSITLEDRTVMTGTVRSEIVGLISIFGVTLMLMILLVFFELNRFVGRPLQKLASDTDRLTSSLKGTDGKDLIKLEYQGDNEVERLTESFQIMFRSVKTAQSALEEKVRKRTRALHKANSKLKRLSESDPLTGFSNRRRVMDQLNALVGKQRSCNSEALSVAIIDLDYFKNINDSYGHLAGDDILREVSSRMCALLRPDDPFGRIGGEEFMAILTGVSSEEGKLVAERIRRGVAMTKFTSHGNGGLKITVSIGIATYREGDTDKTLYARADSCLYAAKNNGRNRVVCDIGLDPVSGDIINTTLRQSPDNIHQIKLRKVNKSND